MPSTTNFGWTTPADTDLVKDGAAAIRTLGNGIDTSFLDLKGGTSGQVLAKNSNTDLDFVWVAQDDSNAIQNAIVDAKGDLISATAADTPARLAVGTNGQILTADSTTSTGLKWATAASSVPANDFARVETNQFTGSTSYTDLTTSGPAVTVTTGTKALVIVSSRIYSQTSSSTAYMSFAVSGATTTAASDDVALRVAQSSQTANQAFRMSAASVATLTAGSNTFTAKYKWDGSGEVQQAHFQQREIFVINLA